MELITGIKERRSIRNFEKKVVDRELMLEIMDAARFAPSWANFQVARYHFVETPELVSRLAHEGVGEFVYNINTLKEATNVLVLTYVKGKSGKLEGEGYESFKPTVDASVWEIFDAGIACQTFCLAAHAKGIGTVIMGVINDKAISEIINLPENESVAALIVYGYPVGEHPAPSPRKPVEKIASFL